MSTHRNLLSSLVISKASLQEMDFFLSKAKEEGWNPGLCDALPFYSTDPNGFFIAKIDGEPVGCISTVAYNDSFGFLGFYIVIPKYRHQGIGIKLWNHGIAYLGSRTIGLDGVVAQQKNYEKSHFKLYYKNIRYEGNVDISITPVNLADLHSVPMETLLAYDTPIFGILRNRFIQKWIDMPNARGLAKLDNGTLLGYGVIRRCHKGYKIGPLFADNLEIADEIFRGLSDKANGDLIYLDVPEINPQALKLAKSYHLQQCFETARMYTQPPSAQRLDKIFGVTTFELG